MPPANAPPPSLVRWGARKVHWRLTILLLSGLPNWNAKRNRRARSTWPFLIDTSKHERSGDWNAAIPMSLDARGCQACRARKSGVEGKSVSVSVDLGGRRIIKTKKNAI